MSVRPNVIVLYNVDSTHRDKVCTFCAQTKKNIRSIIYIHNDQPITILLLNASQHCLLFLECYNNCCLTDLSCCATYGKNVLVNLDFGLVHKS